MKSEKRTSDILTIEQLRKLNKTSLLQDARIFNQTPVHVRKCTLVLTKLLYLIDQGEVLSAREATDTFFAITRLFQCKDTTLRRLVYLSIRRLCASANDVIIVTSSLMRDMTGGASVDVFAACAIRALCAVIVADISCLQTMERYLRQSLAHTCARVSSAALVSATHLLAHAPDTVRRWAGEAFEALGASKSMVQYHALGLVYRLRRADHTAVNKLLSRLWTDSCDLRSCAPVTQCLFVRVVGARLHRHTQEAPAQEALTQLTGNYLHMLEVMLNSRDEMVSLEAARAILSVPGLPAKHQSSAVSVLQVLLNSYKKYMCFAAVRTLSQLGTHSPSLLSGCSYDLERLVSADNRSLAVLALTTLLAGVAADSAVDRLLKQMTSAFLHEIGDDLKVLVVRSIRALGIRYPGKYAVLMHFLSTMLRDDGSLEYKAAIAETIVTLTEQNPDAKEAGLAHLCEFIEDCEHASLAVRILHLLACEGPSTKQPARYIRCVYNRVILETPAVRAAAVTALARFGALCEDLLPNVMVLLRQCRLDTDDEVRDRAAFFYALLDAQLYEISARYVLAAGCTLDYVTALEQQLLEYCAPGGPTELEKPAFKFDARRLAAVAGHKSTAAATELVAGKSHSAADTPTGTRTRHEVFAQRLARVPELADLGARLLKSSEAVDLSGSESEYLVQCVTHVYDTCVVLQFDCTNTIPEQLLQGVHVTLQYCQQPDAEELAVDGQLCVEVGRVVTCTCSYGDTATCYAVFETGACLLTVGTFSARLMFSVHEAGGGVVYEDDYALDDVEVGVAHYMTRAPAHVYAADFEAEWGRLSAEGETQCAFALASVQTIEQAVRQLVALFGMWPCERSDRVPAAGEGGVTPSRHRLLLAAQYRATELVLVRICLVVSAGAVNMQLCVRTQHATSTLGRLLVMSVM